MWLLACLLGTLGVAASAADKKAGGAALPEVPETLTPAQADAFLAKLTDAQVRALLAHELHAKAEKRAVAAPAEARGLGPLLMGLANDMQAGELDFTGMRSVFAQGAALLPDALASAVPRVFGRGVALQLGLLALIVAMAAAAAWAARRALRPHGLEPRIAAGAAVTSRLSAGALRFGLDLVPFALFAALGLALVHAASGAGTAERSFLITYVTGAILVAAVAVLLRVLLAPREPQLSLLPVTERGATFLYRWLLAVWAVTVFASLTAQLLIVRGVPREAGLMLTLFAGTAVAAMVVAMILAARALVATVRLPALLARSWPALGAAYVAAVWLLWASALLAGQPSQAGAAAASLGILLAFPLLDYWIGRAIDDVLGAGIGAGHRGAAVPLRWAMRVLLAVLLLTGAGELWGFHFFEWQVKLRRALLDASLDLLAAFAVAVLGWQFIKFAIDRRLEVREVAGVRVEPSQRLRTLLPLARVFLVTALIATTIMLVLSALGVNIGPLLAGAGILGLAIGFGAQTLVRDIITGVFLILDDAFRVGEYILSGNYKGTVESIGLRSVKLRHHRGPIYVVPFGELRGVQNVSRDWVIMKITVGITYDSDLDKAKKLVKKLGQELAADPEFADEILVPLKMQGVEEFGDFAIEIRMKIMTKPGEKQFMIRRRAYAMIKKSFDANGIKFAFPTVQIAGGGSDAAAAAASTRLPSISGEQAA